MKEKKKTTLYKYKKKIKSKKKKNISMEHESIFFFFKKKNTLEGSPIVRVEKNITSHTMKGMVRRAERWRVLMERLISSDIKK